MAIIGQKTTREYRRDAGETGNAARADRAMAKAYGPMVANPAEKLDTGGA
ncbi:MAG: hypothetical protein AAGI28_07600 [Pseudomonadota bacterium]